MEYTKEDRVRIVADVSARVASGEAVRVILSEKGYPCVFTYYKWLNEDKELKEVHWFGLSVRAHEWFQEVINIANDVSKDYEITLDGKVHVVKENIHRAKLRIDALKWVCSKADAKYSDRAEHTTIGTQLNSISVQVIREKEKTIEIEQ